MINNKQIRSRQARINRKIALVSKTQSKSLKYIFRNIKLLGGKRVRGLFVMLVAESNGKKITSSLVETAVAIELLHHATLIHDDIVDNASKRRGMSTLNKSLGHQFSVLTGDYFFSQVMELIMQQSDIEILRIFSKGIKDVCEGEIEEVYHKYNAALTVREYLNIIDKKTGSLLTCSVETGAYLGGYKNENKKNLLSFGRNLGLAFQIKDDILDMTSNARKLGKPAGYDIKEGKVTLPLILALKSAPKQASDSIKRMIKPGITRKNINKIMAFVKKYKGVELAEIEVGKYISRAMDSLEKVREKDKNKKFLLEIMTSYMVKRSY